MALRQVEIVKSVTVPLQLIYRRLQAFVLAYMRREAAGHVYSWQSRNMFLKAPEAIKSFIYFYSFYSYRNGVSHVLKQRFHMYLGDQLHSIRIVAYTSQGWPEPSGLESTAPPRTRARASLEK